jgi:hypothetical protein
VLDALVAISGEDVARASNEGPTLKMHFRAAIHRAIALSGLSNSTFADFARSVATLL